MKREYLILTAGAIIIVTLAFLVATKKPSKPTLPITLPAPIALQSTNTKGNFLAPLDRVSERVTKKKFGIFITPENSPVQLERFRGYHTGVDFETFPEEQNIDVSVRAICPGSLRLREYASGYGGVAVQDCQLDDQPITVIYGHLKLASIAKSVSEKISKGETLGFLGAAYSSETDGERKHLHLAVHKGNDTNITGYVPYQAALSDWVDPLPLLY